MYRYLFFDLDGTLTDSREGIFNCLRYAFEKMGVEAPDDATLRQFIGPPLQESLPKYCGLTEEQTRQAIALFRERYVPIGKFENVPAPGMVDLCRRLKGMGYVLALASSKPEDMCRAICDKFGFTESMDVISGSPSQGSDWTKTDVIRETMRRLKLTEAQASEILMIGDRRYDVNGAGELGIDCLGVEFFGYAEPGELNAAGAIAVVKTAEEVERFLLA